MKPSIPFLLLTALTLSLGALLATALRAISLSRSDNADLDADLGEGQ